MVGKKIELSERNCRILRSVVQTYIDRAEPVGSRTVAKRSGLGLSPATIRNVMADLEEIGLLYQPHTSAGRVPTEAGLRYFVDYLLEREALSWGDQVAIEEGLRSSDMDLVATLKKAVELLAHFSGHAAVISTPRLTGERLSHVEFIRLRPGLVLVVLVADTGLVHNRLVHLDMDIREDRLEAFSLYLNQRLSRVSLEEARSSILEELEEEKRAFELLLQDLVVSTQGPREEGEVIIGGELNLLDYPEFSNVGRIRAMLQAFQEKRALLLLLERCLESEGVQVFIGSEGLGHKVPGCGMVLAPYLGKEYPLGSLGVVGPMRMNYARVLALVEYTAQVLSEQVKES